MSPNPYILLRNIVNPHRWFRSKGLPEPKRGLEYWEEPLPGAYQYHPGRGWYLIATSGDKGQTFEKLQTPAPVVFCRILGRNLLKTEYDSRKRHGHTRDEHGHEITGIFFRLDDGFTWLYRWNNEGLANPCNKMQPYVVDASSGEFRVKCKGDCVTRSQRVVHDPRGNDSQDENVASPAVRTFVNGDVHLPSPPSTISSFVSTTKSDPSHRSSVSCTRTTATSRGSSFIKTNKQVLPDFDSLELQLRLEQLARKLETSSPPG